MKLARSLGVSAALSLSVLLGAIEAQTYEGRELVKAQLIADTNAIVPGKTFTVGLLLRMVPGWHTYWKFPGDAGIPTELKWKLPAGWKVGEMQWPIPLKLAEPGDIQIYGYRDEVLLTQEITPPASISSSVAKLAADASWLVCEKICIPGSTSVQLELPVESQSSPAHQELFARFRRLLPQDWPGAKVAAAKWNRTGSDLHLNVSSATLVNYPVADFYPLPEANVVVGHPAVETRNGDQITFRIPIESADKSLSSIKGLVVFAQRANGNERGAWRMKEGVGAASYVNSAATHGLLTFLLFGFVGGFILNLMPCVLPVISLKIFGFIQQAGQSRQKILRSGIAFAAGIFAWFIGLALLLIALKSAGHQITWAVQFTNPYFVLFMSVVVLVFALNLFGVFEISLPQSTTRGLLDATAREGEAGSFFQGVFATVLATPCTAPFLGPALGFALAQSPLIIFLMFLSVAAGMAFPYVLLSAQPAWLRFLPKPGPWMVQTKQFMGFLLLATLVFLLYVIGVQRGLDGLIWTCSFLLVVSIACWIKGIFSVPTASAAVRRISVVLMFVLVAGGGFYFIGQKFRSAKVVVGAEPGGDWQPFSLERLQAELDQGRAVFIDFTAAWCLNCKVNERFVLENSAVREAFQQHGVIKLKADWTSGDPVITKFLQRFGRVGVPFYVLYSGKSEEPIVFPELLTKNIVLEKLETLSRTVASQ